MKPLFMDITLAPSCNEDEDRPFIDLTTLLEESGFERGDKALVTVESGYIGIWAIPVKLELQLIEADKGEIPCPSPGNREKGEPDIRDKGHMKGGDKT